ncbi:unnamed protein product [Adineta steineri]|nr:unnamed protein product [Adineta steineri]
MTGWQFECANSACLPFFTRTVLNIFECQLTCLAQSQCEKAIFYQLTSNCELFDSMSGLNTNMLANMETISMIVTSETRIPHG